MYPVSVFVFFYPVLTVKILSIKKNPNVFFTWIILVVFPTTLTGRHGISNAAAFLKACIKKTNKQTKN